MLLHHQDPRSELGRLPGPQPGLLGLEHQRLGQRAVGQVSLVAASIASLHNDEVCRRTLRRHGFLDRVAAFDDDVALHGKIESIVATVTKSPAPAQAPPLREMLARVTTTENLAVGATEQD